MKAEICKRVLAKITSGRWIFTVATAVTFAVMSIRGQLPTDDVKDLMLLIATFYFSQRLVEKTNGNGHSNGA
jgi:hypothetical protein